MSFRNWIRWRWWEFRTGMGNYLSMVATAINTVLIIQLYIHGTGFVVPILVLSVFALAGTALGFMHRKIQQDTDARLANRAVIEDIVKGVLEGLKKK